jgi:hypothetical protein
MRTESTGHKFVLRSRNTKVIESAVCVHQGPVFMARTRKLPRFPDGVQKIRNFSRRSCILGLLVPVTLVVLDRFLDSLLLVFWFFGDLQNIRTFFQELSVFFIQLNFGSFLISYVSPDALAAFRLASPGRLPDRRSVTFCLASRSIKSAPVSRPKHASILSGFLVFPRCKRRAVNGF